MNRIIITMALSLFASCMDVSNDNNLGSPVQPAASQGEPVGLQNCNLEQWLSPRKHSVVITAETDKASSGRPTIRLSITNPTRDSIYFLNRSCDGFLRFVIYDTAEYSINPVMVCNASWFMTDVIAPHAVYKTPYFNLEKKSSKTEEIKFAFIELTSAFPIKNCVFKNLDSLVQVNTISVNNLSAVKAIQPGPLN